MSHLPQTPFQVVGHRSDRYVVMEVLDQGTFGVICSGRSVNDEDDHPTHALKFFLKPSPGEEMTILQMENSDGHPNVLSASDWGVLGIGDIDVPFVVLPLLGLSLDEAIEDKPLSWSEFEDCFQRLVGAVTWLHAQGFLHRDLKCANVLLRSAAKASLAHPIVTDFGLAIEVDAQQTAINASTMVGTPGYFPTDDTSPIDPYRDVFGMAAIAFRATTHRFPVDDSGEIVGFESAYRQAHQGQSPPPEMASLLDGIVDREIIAADQVAKLLESWQENTEFDQAPQSSYPAPEQPLDQESDPFLPMPPEEGMTLEQLGSESSNLIQHEQRPEQLPVRTRHRTTTAIISLSALILVAAGVPIATSFPLGERKRPIATVTPLSNDASMNAVVGTLDDGKVNIAGDKFSFSGNCRSVLNKESGAMTIAAVEGRPISLRLEDIDLRVCELRPFQARIRPSLPDASSITTITALDSPICGLAEYSVPGGEGITLRVDFVIDPECKTCSLSFDQLSLPLASISSVLSRAPLTIPITDQFLLEDAVICKDVWAKGMTLTINSAEFSKSDDALQLNFVANANLKGNLYSRYQHIVIDTVNRDFGPIKGVPTLRNRSEWRDQLWPFQLAAERWIGTCSFHFNPINASILDTGLEVTIETSESIAITNVDVQQAPEPVRLLLVEALKRFSIPRASAQGTWRIGTVKDLVRDGPSLTLLSRLSAPTHGLKVIQESSVIVLAAGTEGLDR